MASGSDDSTIKVWDAVSGREVMTLKGYSTGGNSVAYSPDGQRIASGCRSHIFSGSRSKDKSWLPMRFTA